MNLLKYLTPSLITLLTTFGILAIVIIVSIILLFIFRKRTFVQKIIWNIREIRNLFSNVPSYYSQKRINSFAAFYSAIGIILCYDWTHRGSITASEISAHALILFAIAGYVIKQIQQEKKDDIVPNDPDAPEDPAA